MCEQVGGARRTPGTVRSFLERHGRPLLRTNPMLVRHMGAILIGVAEIVDRPAREVGLAFGSGALLYASAFGYLNRASELPIIDEAIWAGGDRGPADVVVDSRDSIRGEPEFCSLLADTAPVLGVPLRLMEVVQAGAGAVHLVMQENACSELERNPSLADLQGVFRSYGF